MCREFMRRIGVLLLFGAIALIFVFFTSTSTEEPAYTLLGWGLMVVMLAFIIMRWTRPKPKPSRRFRTVRRIFSGRDQEEEYEYYEFDE